jgi:hypothetical protein
MADAPKWDGEIHRAVNFGDPFDWRTLMVERGLRRSVSGVTVTLRLVMSTNSIACNGLIQGS